MRLFRRVSVTTSCIAFLACSAEPPRFFQTVSTDPDFFSDPAEPDRFGDLVAFTADPACAPTVTRKIDGRTEIRIFLGNGITRGMAQRFASGLARYFSYYSLTIFTRHDVLGVPLDHALVLNNDALESWVVENTTVTSAQLQGSAYSDDPEVLSALGAAMFHNTKQFLRAYAYPKQTVLNLVLLRHVVAADASEGQTTSAWAVAGLGLSDEVLSSIAASDIDGESLSILIGERNFTPTIFIGVPLSDFVLPSPDLVVAHEAGHAFGLEHTAAGSSTTLMTQGLKNCNASLSGSQVSTIGGNPLSAADRMASIGVGSLEELSFQHVARRVLDSTLASLSQRNHP